MSKVILVPEVEPILADISVYSFIKTEPEDIVIQPDITPSELVKLFEVGDEVVCHRFIRNAEGIPVGEKYAGIVCHHGAEKKLRSALLTAKDSDSVWDIVSDLAKKLEGMNMS